MGDSLSGAINNQPGLIQAALYRGTSKGIQTTLLLGAGSTETLWTPGYPAWVLNTSRKEGYASTYQETTSLLEIDSSQLQQIHPNLKPVGVIPKIFMQNGWGARDLLKGPSEKDLGCKSRVSEEKREKKSTNDNNHRTGK